MVSTRSLLSFQMARGSALLLAWLLLAATLSATLGLGVPVSADDRRPLKRTKGVRREDQPGAKDGSFSPQQGWGGGEGPKRTAEDQLGTDKLKMALFIGAQACNSSAQEAGGGGRIKSSRLGLPYIAILGQPGLFPGCLNKTARKRLLFVGQQLW